MVWTLDILSDMIKTSNCASVVTHVFLWGADLHNFGPTKFWALQSPDVNHLDYGTSEQPQNKMRATGCPNASRRGIHQQSCHLSGTHLEKTNAIV